MQTKAKLRLAADQIQKLDKKDRVIYIYAWKNIIGIPGEKLTLGVPFYGYDFQNSTM